MRKITKINAWRMKEDRICSKTKLTFPFPNKKHRSQCKIVYCDQMKETFIFKKIYD